MDARFSECPPKPLLRDRHPKARGIESVEVDNLPRVVRRCLRITPSVYEMVSDPGAVAGKRKIVRHQMVPEMKLATLERDLLPLPPTSKLDVSDIRSDHPFWILRCHISNTPFSRRKPPLQETKP
jgi:hypothetical protein